MATAGAVDLSAIDRPPEAGGVSLSLALYYVLALWSYAPTPRLLGLHVLRPTGQSMRAGR